MNFIKYPKIKRIRLKTSRFLTTNKNGLPNYELERRRQILSEKFNQKIDLINQNRSLNKDFTLHRLKLIDIIEIDKNIDDLFKDSCNSDVDYVTSYNDLASRFNGLTYHNEISSSLLLLCQLILNYIVIELNLRNSMEKKVSSSESDFLYRDLFVRIHLEKDKLTILSLLKPWLNDFKPANIDDFFKNLDKSKIQSLLNSFSQSDDLFSVELYRTLFTHIKSNQHLNYERSDITKFVKNNNTIKFTSNTTSNEEYIEKLTPIINDYTSYLTTHKTFLQDEAYSNYFSDKDNENLKNLTTDQQSFIKKHENYHLNLGLEIVKVLLSCDKFIPDFDLFKYLLDHFRSLNLLNYQTLVYKSLPSYQHQPTVLIDSPTLDFYHFQSIIETNPEILSSLLSYTQSRNDVETSKSLLSFYLLDDVANYERVLKSTTIHPILSKSNFTKHKDRQIASNVYYKCDNPLMISVESIYISINCCIDLGLFEYIDSLFNKIVISGIEIDDELKIVLTLGNSESNDDIEYQMLLAKDYSPYEISTKVFTKQIFKLFLKASRVSDDLGRLMWLLPHLDEYLKRNLVYISNIPEDNPQDTPLDYELIKETFDTLGHHGLEGKIKTYEKLLNFEMNDVT